jgi:xanthine/uracil permease
MVDRADSNSVRLASGANILVAIWLYASPWVLTYAGDAGWNSTTVAVAIAVLAAIRVMGAYRASWLSWINVLLGLWLLVAPWFLDFDDVDDATANSVIVGIIVAVLGLWSALSSQERTTTRPPE